MLQDISKLTIVTIAYTYDSKLENTYHSIEYFLSQGAKWILVVHECSDMLAAYKRHTVICGVDQGLYNALNIGIAEVQSQYFALLHSGDTVISQTNFLKAFSLFQPNIDLVLGGSQIGKRSHLSKMWRPWMIDFFVQPPHLPIFYRSKTCKGFSYSEKINVIADFYYLRDLFFIKKAKYVHSELVYVRMVNDGLTTSGIKSIYLVTRSFAKKEGLIGWLKAPFRLAIKMIIR